MTAELPKVIWTSQDGMRRAVFVDVDDPEDGGPMIVIEFLEDDAMGVRAWRPHVAEYDPIDDLVEALADLSGVKWRETSGDG